MDDNLVMNGRTFTLQYKDAEGSVRKDVSSGINLPSYLRIRSQQVLENKTKRPAIQTQVSCEVSVLSSDGVTILPVMATLTIRIPQDTGIDTSEALAPGRVLLNLLQDSESTDDEFNKLGAIVVNGEM
jgi:hypothetical protein